MKQKTGRKLLSFLLALALVLSLASGAALAGADSVLDVTVIDNVTTSDGDGWQEIDSLPTTSGSYRLTQDV